MRKRFISVRKRGKSKGAADTSTAEDEQMHRIPGHEDTSVNQQSLLIDDSQSITRRNLAHTTIDTFEMTTESISNENYGSISNEDNGYSDQEEIETETVDLSPDAVHGKDLEHPSEYVPQNQLKRSTVHRPLVTQRRRSGTNKLNRNKQSEEKENLHLEDPILCKIYETIPELDLASLPRGGTSIETEAVGRIQFGIPPETIKDSMRMGLDVPLFYIVPVERFCREMGPALGVNLAEFEFPAYFNFFIQKKRCTLIVDSEDAERNIRRVFGETLLGPAQFRRDENPMSYREEDFAPDFPRDSIPDFRKELEYFRAGPDGNELVIETLLNFTHFKRPSDFGGHEHIGMPPRHEVLNTASNQKEDARGTDELYTDTSKGSIFPRVRLCEMAVLYPPSASQEEIDAKSCKRVEIFKMPGAAEYIVHDIDEKNNIVGKGRFSGSIRVSANLSVHGFGESIEDQETSHSSIKSMKRYSSDSIPRHVLPPSFHPPSFGVTILGNSHGFDQSGSVSGYVLWINGRGVMIDPPPYSSATLEREGIRPRTIVGIILTHCHADHDAGAFQKVLTGSPVAVITTPTIYKSFIRKYAALSALSPVLLRHSHRHKPAIIGKPLRFQGATFYFTYTLHSIPCIGFRVEWRGRSMVFTGDHLNCPDTIAKLQNNGTITAARAKTLLNLATQDTDLLLHEAGVPPLHTPLEVLMALPKHIKERLYVVHTTPKLLEGSDLRVAPTGTAGTIRLDEIEPSDSRHHSGVCSSSPADRISYDDEVMLHSLWISNEYETSIDRSSFIHTRSDNHERYHQQSSGNRTSSLIHRFRMDSSVGCNCQPPRVALRPTSSTDAWFILNLLSAVPFLSGLPYSSTMEVLETSRVDVFKMNDIVVPAKKRRDVLCLVWEGTCMEKKCLSNQERVELELDDEYDELGLGVWHAGDWTSPLPLQPEKALSGESATSSTHDVVAMSSQGVKVIMIEYSLLHSILKSGSELYRAYLNRKAKKISDSFDRLPSDHFFQNIVKNVEVLDIIESNSTLRKISAVQKRHFESLAGGPVYFAPGERLWNSGAPVDKAYLIVGGTASFLARRKSRASANFRTHLFDECLSSQEDEEINHTNTLGETMWKSAEKVRLGLGYSKKVDHDERSLGGTSSSVSSINIEDIESIVASEEAYNMFDNQDYIKLSEGLQKRAVRLGATSFTLPSSINTLERTYTDRRLSGSDRSAISDSTSGTEDADLDNGSFKDNTPVSERRRSSIDRFANKQLVRLYNRRSFTAGLVFSQGHFLGDISKMMAGLLSSTGTPTYFDDDHDEGEEDQSGIYGFGENKEGNSGSKRSTVSTIQEQEGDQQVVHSSTLAAGKDGCVVFVFSKSNLIPFFDEHPGLLLSLLGTQVVL